MTIYLTENEVLELAIDYLDMINPDPDKVQRIAELMDMKYDERLDMFEDVEEISLRKYRRQVKNAEKLLESERQVNESLRHALNKAFQPSPENCNHDWFDDYSQTVALRRCRRCPATEGITKVVFSTE